MALEVQQVRDVQRFNEL